VRKNEDGRGERDKMFRPKDLDFELPKQKRRGWKKKEDWAKKKTGRKKKDWAKKHGTEKNPGQTNCR
jgi:hypothetical protein